MINLSGGPDARVVINVDHAEVGLKQPPQDAAKKAGQCWTSVLVGSTP